MPEQENQDLADLAISVDWSEAAATPVTHVNQFVGQPGPPNMDGTPDGVYLLFGSIPPPLIPTDPEGQKRALEALKDSGIKVTGHARFHLSRQRLEELIVVLQSTADNYDRVAGRDQTPQGLDGEPDTED